MGFNSGFKGLITQHDLKLCRGAEIHSHAFVTSVIDGGKGLASFSSRLKPEKRSEAYKVFK